MREKNRKPIASYIKLPQFTTMNVIDGQAGVIIYSSLICYSLTIDNILNIIVLLILATVSVHVLTGDNGLLQKAQTAKEEQNEAKELELIKLAVSAAQVAGEGTITKKNLDKELQANFNDDREVKEKEDCWTYKGCKINKDGEVDKWLPEEYQEVEYIQNSGEQYIIPKIDWNECNGNIKLVTTLIANNPFGNILKIPMEKVTRLFISSWRPYIAIEKDEEKQDVYTTRLWGVVAQSPTVISADFSNGILESTNDSSSERETFNTTQSTSTGDMIFFAVKSYLYDAKFYVNSNMVRNYIPCCSTTTVIDVNGKECPKETKGLYDTVEGKFYTNQGAGEFISGPEV